MLRNIGILLALLLLGCTNERTREHKPLQEAIDNGKEVWKLVMDEEDDITHYVVLDGDKVDTCFTRFKSGKWASWDETSGNVATKTVSGTRDSDGTIRIKTVRTGNISRSTTETEIDPSGKVKQHWKGSAEGVNDRANSYFGAAARISP